jgi:hypothetical protein
MPNCSPFAVASSIDPFPISLDNQGYGGGVFGSTGRRLDREGVGSRRGPNSGVADCGLAASATGRLRQTASRQQNQEAGVHPTAALRKRQQHTHHQGSDKKPAGVEQTRSGPGRSRHPHRASRTGDDVCCSFADCMHARVGTAVLRPGNPEQSGRGPWIRGRGRERLLCHL